jgi:large subunit ribosomal protein L11
MKIKLLTEGGNLTPGQALSQKLGPLGMNVNQIIEGVNKETSDFKGLKVPVELDIDPSTKEFSVKVFSPPASELMKKEIGIEKGSGAQKKIKAANASIEQVIAVAKSKYPNMLSRDLKAAVKTIVGTCGSLGILIENKTSLEVQEEINEGKYDKEIQEEKTETSEEKKNELEEYFEEVKKKQDIVLKQEQAAKESEAEKKEEEAKEGENEEKPAEETKDTKDTKK